MKDYLHRLGRYSACRCREENKCNSMVRVETIAGPAIAGLASKESPKFEKRFLALTVVSFFLTSLTNYPVFKRHFA